jgi:GxxExxY protein
MTGLLHADLTYTLRGIAFSVHNELRSGHEEAVYETAMAYAFEDAGVPFQEQPVYHIEYRGQQVGEYRPDFAVGGGQVLIDLKATPQVQPFHKAQMISYLAVTHAELGLIMNFGAQAMQIERIPNFLAHRQVEANPPPIPEDGKLLYPELCHRTLDALAQVHHTLGIGFLHQVYRRAARVELAARYIETCLSEGIAAFIQRACYQDDANAIVAGREQTTTGNRRHANDPCIGHRAPALGNECHWRPTWADRQLLRNKTRSPVCAAGVKMLRLQRMQTGNG